MANWFHRLLNPHCPDCMAEKICDTCEILKDQLAIANREKQELLNKLTAKPNEEVREFSKEVTPPRNVPWAVRRQMLETEDREKARLLKDAPKAQSTEELEKELGIT